MTKFQLKYNHREVRVLMRSGEDYVLTKLPREFVARRLEGGVVSVDGDAPDGFTVRVEDMWLHQDDLEMVSGEPEIKVRKPRPKAGE